MSIFNKTSRLCSYEIVFIYFYRLIMILNLKSFSFFFGKKNKLVLLSFSSRVYFCSLRERSHQNISVLKLVRNPQSRLKISESVGKDEKKMKINDKFYWPIKIKNSLLFSCSTTLCCVCFFRRRKNIYNQRLLNLKKLFIWKQ